MSQYSADQLYLPFPVIAVSLILFFLIRMFSDYWRKYNWVRYSEVSFTVEIKYETGNKHKRESVIVIPQILKDLVLKF